VTETQLTRRPVPASHQGKLEALVYVKQTCQTFPLPDSGSVRFGRGPSNDIRVDDPSVSRFHLVLHIEDGAVTIEDLGSANGTRLFAGGSDDTLDEPTTRTDTDAKLESGQRRPLGPGDFIRAGIALIIVQPSRPNQRSVASLSSRPPSDSGPAVLLDPEMRRAYDIAVRAAASGISVLITGETGSGKEIFAETIHARSNRRGKPLLRLNCAALTETLLESELFGHERGAFTGATQAKAGLLESNDEGTVFLDEIGEMPLATQAKLLRVLEEKSILRVGATKPRPIDVRFIWATNRDLRAEAKLGRFRQDLYFRIAGVEFSIPPLRQRPSEIEPLARLFLERFCRRSGIKMPELTADAVQALHRYSWPGNVRELKNVMERAPFMCGGSTITSEHVPVDVVDPVNGLFDAEENETTEVFISPRSPGNRNVARPAHDPAAQALSPDDERERITEALEQCAGNQTRAAELLGVSRRTLINKLERLSMPRPKKR
jgi:two-component system, NtrC family, response regulator AtoC